MNSSFQIITIFVLQYDVLITGCRVLCFRFLQQMSRSLSINLTWKFNDSLLLLSSPHCDYETLQPLEANHKLFSGPRINAPPGKMSNIIRCYIPHILDKYINQCQTLIAQNTGHKLPPRGSRKLPIPGNGHTVPLCCVLLGFGWRWIIPDPPWLLYTGIVISLSQHQWRNHNDNAEIYHMNSPKQSALCVLMAPHCNRETGSSLTRIMACCLMTPSHYLPEPM